MPPRRMSRDLQGYMLCSHVRCQKNEFKFKTDSLAENWSDVTYMDFATMPFGYCFIRFIMQFAALFSQVDITTDALFTKLACAGFCGVNDWQWKASLDIHLLFSNTG